MTKEYQFACKECGGIFTTYDKEMPICRGCQRATALTRSDIIFKYGKPLATALQEAKWGKARTAIQELKEK